MSRFSFTPGSPVVHLDVLDGMYDHSAFWAGSAWGKVALDAKLCRDYGANYCSRGGLIRSLQDVMAHLDRSIDKIDRYMEVGKINA